MAYVTAEDLLAHRPGGEREISMITFNFRGISGEL